MAILFTNGASSLLAAGINDTQTSLTVSTGEGVLFPNPTGGDYFVLVVEDAAGNAEVMQCTARATDTLTVVRGFDNSTAQAFSAGARVELRLTAHTEEEMIQRSGDTMTGQLKGITPVAAEDLARKDYVDTKAAKVPGTNNNIATLDGTGELKNSGLSVANISQAELDTLDGLTASTAELNVLDGYTGSVTELNYLDSLHATGVTATEFDYLDGVTSNIQTQIDAVENFATFVTSGESPTLVTTPVQLAAVLTENTWTTIGPTGSGATYIWTALDSVPSDADWIEVKAYTFFQEASPSAGTHYYAVIYAADGDDASPATSAGYIMSQALATAQSASYTIQSVGMGNVKIPLNASGIFKARWTSSTTTAPTCSMFLVGYGKNGTY